MTASLGVQVFKSICFEIHVCCFYCHLLLFCHALKNKKMCTGNFGKKDNESKPSLHVHDYKGYVETLILFLRLRSLDDDSIEFLAL